MEYCQYKVLKQIFSQLTTAISSKEITSSLSIMNPQAKL